MARSKKDVTVHRENPFMGNGIAYSFPVRQKKIMIKGGKAIVDRETGEEESSAEITQIKWVDGEQFIKIFTQNLKIFFDLKPTTFKILQVLLSQLQRVINSDIILLNITVVEDYFIQTKIKKISKASFHNCIKELIDKHFIAQSHLGAGMYFINPHLFFNGDRVKFTTEIRKRKNAKDQREEFEAMGQQTLALEVPEKEGAKLLEATK